MDLGKLLKCITIGGTKLEVGTFAGSYSKAPKSLPEKAQLCTRVEALGGVGGRGPLEERPRWVWGQHRLLRSPTVKLQPPRVLATFLPIVVCTFGQTEIRKSQISEFYVKSEKDISGWLQGSCRGIPLITNILLFCWTTIIFGVLLKQKKIHD